MIAIIDYGMGNLRSVEKGFEKVGHKVCVSSNFEEVRDATAIVLPGVGAFDDAMKNLKDLGMIDVILDHIKEGKPYLGICLGLQLLFSESEEEGPHKGLDIFKGMVKRLPKGVKVPHIGWNQIKKQSESPLFKDIPEGSCFYFVHSYYPEPEDKTVIATTTEYGIEFMSGAGKDNVWAVQFHPEKSSTFGLKILDNFGRFCYDYLSCS